MKIAFPAQNENISEHFGHCANFKVFEVDDHQNIVNQSLVVAPQPHQPGILPKLLHDHQVDVVIAGGMGQKAIELFANQGIKVIIGAHGSIQAVLELFLSGKLQNGENCCSH